MTNTISITSEKGKSYHLLLRQFVIVVTSNRNVSSRITGYNTDILIIDS